MRSLARYAPWGDGEVGPSNAAEMDPELAENELWEDAAFAATVTAHHDAVERERKREANAQRRAREEETRRRQELHLQRRLNEVRQWLQR